MSEIHALSGAYVLDAVNDVERAEFERHLSSCTQCQGEVEGLRETAARLPDAASTPPPPELRARILTHVQAVRPLPPVVRSERPRRRPRVLVAAAALLVAMAAGVTATVWHPWQPAAIEPGTGQLGLADQVRAAVDAKTWTTRLPDGGRMSVTRSKSVGAAVWRSTGVGPAPRGHVYELWLQLPDQSLAPAGLMSSGDGELVLRGDATHAIGAGLTVEPAGGSAAPTTKPVAFFDFRVTS